ncbi:hypothetical protein Tco_0508565 [Tanacetum coccineum]
MLAICKAKDPVAFKAPKTSSKAEKKVTQGTKPGAKSGRRKKKLDELYMSSGVFLQYQLAIRALNVLLFRGNLKEAQTSSKELRRQAICRALEFQRLSEHVFLKLSPTPWSQGFGIRAKQLVSFLRTFEILIAVEVTKYASSYVVSYPVSIRYCEDLSFTERAESMLDRQERASKFRRYLNRKRDNRKWLLKALDEGPYEFKNFVPEGSKIPRLLTIEDPEGDDLLLYDAEMELMNMILLSIPNEIYNSVDACTLAKDMWKRVERLMRGTIQNKVDRDTHFMNEFDQFVAELGEALVFVYNHFAQLMNDLDRNNMNFPTVTINTKFLNSLQPEWLKYVTQFRLAKQFIVDSFDDIFDYLQQFEKLVNSSRAKKLEKSHDPLALVAHTGSSSRQTSSYYVTHPTSVDDYDDEY